MGDLDTMAKQALDMLPADGSKVTFDAYKSQLYAANEANGKDVFTHLLKKELVGRELGRDSNGKVVVHLFRLKVK